MFEPSADARIVASTMRQIYVAYLQEGFTEEQAMSMIIAMLGSPGLAK